MIAPRPSVRRYHDASDPRVGAPFFLSAVLSAAALVLALVHFSRSARAARYGAGSEA